MKKSLIYLLTVMIFFSCSKEMDIINPEEEIKDYFNLSQTQFTASSAETQFKISISTNTYWEVLSKPDWISITSTNGNKEVELQITLSENDTSSARNGEIKFKTINKNYVLNVSQQSMALKLVSYSGSESPIKMGEPKYLLFNKPITLNYISSGEERYSFFVGPSDVEYFNENHGVKFTVGPSNLGSIHKYRFSVKDSENKILEEVVDLNFFTKKIIIPGAVKEMILDDENNLWVLSLKV